MANLVCITSGVFNSSMNAIHMDDNIVSATFTSSSSNQQSAAIAAPANGKLCANVVTDTNIYIAVGTNPNAGTATTARKLVLAGGDILISMKAGDKIALINA